jgi:ABC-type lipoprotein export system ATPase subunit
MRVELRNVHKSCLLPEGGLFTVLAGVDLLLESGDCCIVAGHSGSGRTTLLNIIGGLARPTSGSVLLDGTVLRRPAMPQGQIGFMFQDPYFVPELTVMENLLLPALRCTSESIRARGEQLLDYFGLAEMFDLFPAILSRGERQRLNLARALLLSPRLLLLDEPTACLDMEWQKKSMQLILGESRDLRATLVMATRDPVPGGEACRYLRMQRGKVIEYGA